MKKVSLIMLGLAFTFAGLQSFKNDDVATSEKTVITAVDENWTNDHVDGTDQVLVATWRVTPCTTPQGASGTTCAWAGGSNPVCFNPRNAKFLCNSNSSS